MAEQRFVYSAGEEEGGGPGNAEGTGIAPGFSDVPNSDEFKQAVAQNKRVGCIAVAVALPLITAGIPLIVLLIEGDGKLNAAALGGVVVIMLLVEVIVGIATLVKNARDKDWDGVVTDQYERDVRERKGSGDNAHYVTEHQYFTEFRTDDGKVKKHSETTPLYYHYLTEGDRVRYHKGLEYPYEPYDKSHVPYLVCAFCGKKADPSEDACPSCKKPLIK